MGVSGSVSAADGETTGALSTRDHIRNTIARARAAIRASRERTALSRSVLTRSAELAVASERTMQASLGLREQLRATVVAYVRQLKADGLPPERVLVLVKAAVLEATPPEFERGEARALMEEAVRWSVEAYYEAA